MFLIIFLASTSVLSALAAIASARHARKTHEHMDAHMRAVDVLNDPDLDSTEDEPRGGRRNLRLLSVVGATPGAVDWMRDKVKAHPRQAASVFALAAAAGYVALIWPAVMPDAPISLNQPPPITSPATAPSESPVYPTGPPPARLGHAATIEPPPPVPQAAATATGRPSSSARPTASPKPQLGSPTTTSAPSVSSSACEVGGENVDGVRFPCVAK